MIGTEGLSDESKEALEVRKLKAEVDLAEAHRDQARTRYVMEMTRTAAILFSAAFGAVGVAKVIGLIGS